MRDYPLKVYLSTSWHEADAALSSHVVKVLANANLTVVGDHPDYQRDDPFDRPWTKRVHSLVSDCSGVVAILPSRESVQTTSPYMFPELLAAADHGLPLLLFTHQGIQLETRETILRFGENDGSQPLGPSQLEADPGLPLEQVRALDLHGIRHLAGPYKLPGTENLDLLIGDFSRNHLKRVEAAFVFNILPFSLRNREHLEISKAVFEETGLPCRIALDGIGESQEMRKQWRETLECAEFAIADLSQIRDACLFEAGVVLGLRKKLFLLAHKSAPSIPYGLDDAPMIVYQSRADLSRVVREQCCAEYKRKVYNLDPELISPSSISKNGGGIPKWFSNDPDSRTASSKLGLSCWLGSIALALVLWSALVWAGSSDSPATFVGVGLTALFGLGAQTREVRQFLELRLIERANKIFGFSVGLAFLAMISLVAAYAMRP